MQSGPCNSPPAETSETCDRVLIAANPRAGASSPGGTVERLASVLRHHQFRVEIFTDLDTVTAAAERAWQAGELRALVAAGGDGTVAELVNRTKVGVPIAVFPLGTANLLAGYLGIRPTFQPFARMLKRGAIIRLDAGKAAGRIFLLMVGCGFDAEVWSSGCIPPAGAISACGVMPNQSSSRSVGTNIRNCGFGVAMRPWAVRPPRAT